MGEEQFGHIFGPPHAKGRDGRWKYSWDWEQQLTDEEKKRASAVYPGVDVSKGQVSVTVKAFFSNHTLRDFYISKVEVL